jgi:hypothetical protein
MSAPNHRIPDNAPKLSWFVKKPNGNSPEQQAADDAVKHLRDIPDDPFDYVSVPLKSAAALSREIDHLDEIKYHLRQLTWAKMLEFCAGIKKDEPKDVHEWSSK